MGVGRDVEVAQDAGIAIAAASRGRRLREQLTGEMRDRIHQPMPEQLGLNECMSDGALFMAFSHSRSTFRADDIDYLGRHAMTAR
jgi:hypothetical protein